MWLLIFFAFRLQIKDKLQSLQQPGPSAGSSGTVLGTITGLPSMPASLADEGEGPPDDPLELADEPPLPSITLTSRRKKTPSAAAGVLSAPTSTADEILAFPGREGSLGCLVGVL